MTAGEIGYWAILILAGGACGFLNTLASSGSAVTLPLLLMLGMPEGAANATNRLPVMIGSIAATLTFQRQRQIDWRAAAWLVPPAAIGTIVGVMLAEKLPNRDMGLLITAAVLVALLLLFTKIKTMLAQEIDRLPQVTPVAMALMLFVGFWLGLIVLDGATYLLLVLMLVCAYKLPQANALKMVIVVVTTAVAIAMFWSKGDIRLAEGLVLAAGSIVGGYFGARLSGHVHARMWAFRLLVLAISLELVHLGWHYSAPLRAAI
jgi:hypothetical protein